MITKPNRQVRSSQKSVAPSTPVRRAGRRVPTEFYVVRIDQWDWALSFRRNNTQALQGAYLDARHLKVSGSVLRPKSAIAGKAQLTFIPTPALLLENWPHQAPEGIAEIYTNKGVLEGVIGFPSDALAPLLVALTAGRLSYVSIEGTPMVDSLATVFGFRISSSYDEADMPPEKTRAPRRQ